MSVKPNFCGSCGSSLIQDAKFCASCGGPVGHPVQKGEGSPSQIAHAWTWLKSRSLKGKLFFGYWIISNLYTLGAILVILVTTPSYPNCTRKFSMRLFLEGIDQSCGPTRGEQVSSQFINIVFFNLFMLLFQFLYRKWQRRKSSK